MLNLIKVINCEMIVHVEVPTDLLSPASKKRKGTLLGEEKESNSDVKHQEEGPCTL